MNLNSTDIKQIRKFGLIALIFFGSLCFLGIWREKLLPAYLFGALSVIGLGFVLRPIQLKPVFLAWLKIAHFIGRVITTLMLTLTYFLAVTPTALIKRLFGSTPLPVKPDKKILSYWEARTESIQPKERYSKRY